MVEQHGLTYPAQADKEEALARPTLPDALQGDAGRFQQRVPTGEFRRRCARARSIRVVYRVHRPGMKSTRFIPPR
jgi:hypothetical protein